MCVVAAELSAGMKGIGFMLTDARSLAQTDKVFAGMLSIGVVGKIMDSVPRMLEAKLIKWRGAYRRMNKGEHLTVCGLSKKFDKDGEVAVLENISLLRE